LRIWTAHLRPGAAPVLLPEGFAWGGLVFGPLWLLAHRAWIPATVDFALGALVVLLAGDALRPLLLVTLAVAQGVFGRDLVRWSLERRHYALLHVVAARNEEAAILRLLQRRPDLGGAFVPPGDLP
jgi:hypothetical protein